MGPSMAEVCVKHIGIVLTAYYVMLRVVPGRFTDRQKLIAAAGAVLIGIAAGSIYNYVPVVEAVIILLLFYWVMKSVFRLNGNYCLTLTLVSVGVSYLIHMVALATTIFLIYLNKLAVADRFGRSVDAWIYVLRYVTSFKGGMITRSFIFALQFAFTWAILKLRPIKMDHNDLVWTDRNRILIFLWVEILSLRQLFLSSVFTRSDSYAVLIICIFLGLLFFLISYFWLQKELASAYQTELQENELQLLEKSLDSKEMLYRIALADNGRLAELIHKNNKLIPSAVMAFTHTAADGLPSPEAAGAIEEISAELRSVLAQYEAHRNTLPKTGNATVDEVLRYYAQRADALGMHFHAVCGADLGSLSDAAQCRGEFIAILADLCEYAVLSSKGVNACEISVTIGREEEILFIEAADSGAPFDMRLLKKIGKKPLRETISEKLPCRKRSDNSGSTKKDDVKGLIPLFRILRHNRAVLSVNEFPDGGIYSKTVRVMLEGQEIIGDCKTKKKKA